MEKSPFNVSRKSGKRKGIKAWAICRDGVGVLLDMEIDGDGGQMYYCIYKTRKDARDARLFETDDIRRVTIIVED